MINTNHPVDCLYCRLKVCAAKGGGLRAIADLLAHGFNENKADCPPMPSHLLERILRSLNWKLEMILKPDSLGSWLGRWQRQKAAMSTMNECDDPSQTCHETCMLAERIKHLAFRGCLYLDTDFEEKTFMDGFDDIQKVFDGMLKHQARRGLKRWQMERHIGRHHQMEFWRNYSRSESVIVFNPEQNKNEDLRQLAAIKSSLGYIAVAPLSSRDSDSNNWPELKRITDNHIKEGSDDGETALLGNCGDWLSKLCSVLLLYVRHKADSGQFIKAGASSITEALINHYTHEWTGNLQALHLHFENIPATHAFVRVAANRCAAVNEAEVVYRDCPDLPCHAFSLSNKYFIYCHAQMDPMRQAWSIVHELGHFRLNHLPASSIAFDLSCLPDKERELFVCQENEANTFADLWLAFFGLKPDEEDRKTWNSPIETSGKKAREELNLISKASTPSRLDQSHTQDYSAKTSNCLCC
jgi:IrrE N-terminal-like domain